MAIRNGEEGMKISILAIFIAGVAAAAPAQKNPRANIFPFSEYRDKVPVQAELVGLAGARTRLENEFLVVTNAGGARGAPGKNGDYIFTPEKGTSAFDEAQVYWAGMKAVGYFKDAGFVLSGKPLQVRINYNSSGSVAACAGAFNSKDRAIEYSTCNGRKKRPASRYNDTFAHEFGHFVFNDLFPSEGLSSAVEGDGDYDSINEGVADFFAYAVFGSPLRGEGRLGPGYTRSLMNNMYFGAGASLVDDSQEAHSGGMAVGGALYDLSVALNSPLYVSKLVLQALRELPRKRLTYLGFMNALVAADNRLNNGARADAIRGALGNRGLYETGLRYSASISIPGAEEYMTMPGLKIIPDRRYVIKFNLADGFPGRPPSSLFKNRIRAWLSVRSCNRSSAVFSGQKLVSAGDDGSEAPGGMYFDIPAFAGVELGFSLQQGYGNCDFEASVYIGNDLVSKEKFELRE